MCDGLMCLEGLVSWVPPSRPTLTVFLPSLLKDSLDPKGRDVTETSHLGLRIPVSHSSNVVQLWVSVCSPPMMAEQDTDL